MSSRKRITVSLFALALTLGLTGCDKVQQCNKLVNTINTNTPKLTAAMEKFGEVQTNPAVADDYVKAVDAAAKDIAGLELDDETVAGFAGRYKDLLERAKGLGPAMKEARADAAKLQEVVADTNNVRETEQKLVEEVNAYCGGQS